MILSRSLCSLVLFSCPTGNPLFIDNAGHVIYHRDRVQCCGAVADAVDAAGVRAMRVNHAFAVISLLALVSMTVSLLDSCNSCNQSRSTAGNTTNSTSSSVSLITTTQAQKALNGKEIIDYYCAVCHNELGCENPPTLLVGFPAQVIEDNVRGGNGWGMPAFQGFLSEDQIAAIVTYLSGSSKGPPPPEIAAAGLVASLYWDKCSGCHGVDRQGGTGPALVPQTLADVDKEMIKATISNGRPGTAMPPWRGTLTALQIDDLIDYILSPVQESALTWGIDDMCGNCVKVTPTDQLPTTPIWGGKVKDLMVVTERDIGHLMFIDSATNRVVGDIEAGYAIHAPTFTPKAVNDRWLFAIARNGWLIKVDLYSLQVVGKIRVGLDSRGTAVSTDGKYVMVGNYIPNTAVIVDAETLKPLKVIEASGLNPAGEMVKSRVAAVLSTPVGPYFEFALKEAGQVWVVDYSKEDFPMVKQITNVGNILHDGFLTPDGRYLQVASQADGTIVVIDLKELSIVKKIPAGKQPHPGSGAVFESQGHLLAATPAIGQGLVTIWDTATWEVVKTIPTPGPGMFIRSNPNSHYVWVDCSANSDSWDNIVVFDKDTLSIVATLQPGKRSIHPEFTPDGKYVYVSCWNDNKVVVYDANTLQKITEFTATTPTGIFSAGVRQVEPGA